MSETHETTAIEPAAAKSLLATAAQPAEKVNESPAPASPAPEGTQEQTNVADGVAKTEGEKPAEGDKPAEPAPAFVEADLKLPEGIDVASPEFGKFKELITTEGLTTKQAQAALDMHTTTVKSIAESFAKSQNDAWAKTNDAWVKEIKADPVIGGDKLTREVLPAISGLLDEFGGPEVRQALDLTGAGNNPALTRFLYKIAEARREGKHIEGSPASDKTPKSAAQIMYPNLAKG